MRTVVQGILAFSFLVSSLVSAQQFNPDTPIADDINPKDVIHWTLNQAIRDPSGRIEIGLTLSTSNDFTIYQDKLTPAAPAGYKMVDLKTPQAKTLKDPISGEEVQVFTAGEFFYYFDPAEKMPNSRELRFQLTYTGCTNVICLFPHTEKFHAAVHPTGNTIELPSDKAKEMDSVPQDTGDAKDDAGFSESLTKQISGGGLSLPVLLLLIFLGGILTNLTPCVYPMIPITLRLLGGQSHRAFLNSSMYAAGILITYTGLGVFAASTGGMFGALLQSKAVNIFFASVMFLLGFTMLGFGNFSKLQQMGDRLGAGKPSLRNMFLMGVGAGFVASPCTGPVLGALLTITLESQDLNRGILMMFTYSFGFALPYVFLGGAAAKASKVKLAPKWQFLTKLIFSSVMFGLSLYYLRIPLYTQLKVIKPYWSYLAWSFTGISVVLILVWLSSVKLQMQKSLTLMPAILTGIAVFCLSQYITTASPDSSELVWYKSESAGFAEAARSGKPIVIDGWAEWCEACKKMEATTFKDPTLVAELSEHWILIKLDLTEDSEANDATIDKYEMPGLPTMVLLPKDANLEKKVKIVGEKSATYFIEELKKYRQGLK